MKSRSATWRGHSCLPRRDSSRRFSQRVESTAKGRVVWTLAVSDTGSEKRRDESQRGRHECPRHVLGSSTFHSQAQNGGRSQEVRGSSRRLSVVHRAPEEVG
jgi:hypothetical protein